MPVRWGNGVRGCAAARYCQARRDVSFGKAPTYRYNSLHD